MPANRYEQPISEVGRMGKLPTKAVSKSRSLILKVGRMGKLPTKAVSKTRSLILKVGRAGLEPHGGRLCQHAGTKWGVWDLNP